MLTGHILRYIRYIQIYPEPETQETGSGEKRWYHIHHQAIRSQTNEKSTINHNDPDIGPCFRISIC